MEERPEQQSAFQESKDGRMDPSYSDGGRLHSIPRFSEKEVKILAGMLEKDETFIEAQQVLRCWLEEGQCNEGNCELFCDLIHLCSNRFKKLQANRKEYLEETQKVQKSVEDESRCIYFQLNDIEEVFKVIQKEDILGCFTQDQVKKISEMSTDILDFKQNISTSSVGIEGEKSSQTSEDLETKCHSEKESAKSKLEYENKMQIVSAVSCYLFKYPGGKRIDCIYKYVTMNTSIPTTCAKIEDLIRSLPKIFKESLPIGATLEKKWSLVNEQTINELMK